MSHTAQITSLISYPPRHVVPFLILICIHALAASAGFKGVSDGCSGSPSADITADGIHRLEPRWSLPDGPQALQMKLAGWNEKGR